MWSFGWVEWRVFDATVGADGVPFGRMTQSLHIYIAFWTCWTKGMVTLGNRGQDDRYIRLWPRNILLPAVSWSCDCHVVQQRSVSQYLLQSWMKEVMVLTANNPSGKRKEGIIVLCLALFSTFARETLILRCVIIVDVFSHQGGWCIFNLSTTFLPTI